MPCDVSRGVCSIQSTGQKLMQASQPVQLSGITTAISFGFFFLRVILPGASGMISVGFAFFGSYATYQCAPSKVTKSLYSETDTKSPIVTRAMSVLISAVRRVKGKIIEYT